MTNLTEGDLSGLVVKPDVAQKQLDEERPQVVPPIGPPDIGVDYPPQPAPITLAAAKAPKRFHGSVRLDPLRTGSEAGRVSDEVLSHLAGLVGADVTIMLEIEATIPSGAPEHVVPTVTENARTLRFDDASFEEE